MSTTTAAAATNHMSAQVKACIDTDRIQPTNELECTSKCPSLVKNRCLICGFYKTSIEDSASKKYARVGYCTPVLDEIRRLYGEDQTLLAQRSDDSSSSKRRFVECAVVCRPLNIGSNFEDEITQLLTEGWQCDGRLHVKNVEDELIGVQMFTRTLYVVATVVGEDDCDCDEHNFVPQSKGGYVCSLCACHGVKLRMKQRLQLDEGDSTIISTALYEKRYLPWSVPPTPNSPAT